MMGDIAYLSQRLNTKSVVKHQLSFEATAQVFTSTDSTWKELIFYNTMLEAMRYDDVGFKEGNAEDLSRDARMILSQARENNCFSYH